MGVPTETDGGDRRRCSDIQSLLEAELERIEERLGVGLGLRVVWMPDETKHLSGEVKGNVIYIYEADTKEAIRALRHEVVDHLLTSRIVKPLVRLINTLIKSREAEIYREKEKLVEILSRLI
jgi:hypothetical protein